MTKNNNKQGKTVKMDLMYWALAGLGAFVAIWILFVAPAERRHHERKLELLQQKIEKRQAGKAQENNDSSAAQNNVNKES